MDPRIFWTFDDSTSSFTSGLMKPGRLKLQETGQTRAPPGHFGLLAPGFFLTFLDFKSDETRVELKEARQGPRLDKPRSRPVCGSHVNHVNTLLRDCHNCHTNTRLYNSRCVCFFNQLTTLSARNWDLVPVTSRIKGDLEFVDF